MELVAVCDPLVERVQRHAQAYSIEHAFQDIDQMLCELDFELLVNLTPMPCMHLSIAKPWRQEGMSGVRSPLLQT